MKKQFCHICLALVALMCTTNGYALGFKEGTYYFDNSKLHFSNVKMVLGNNQATYVYDMMSLGDESRLKGRINQDLSDITGFCFIDSDTLSGTYNKGLQLFLKSAYSNPDFRQTKVLESLNTWEEVTGWVFCPLNDTPKSDGYWRPIDSYDVAPSETLPIIHINTQDSVTIADKENYIDGIFWLDNCGIEGYESMGSASNPLTIQIKGRGNWTWDNLYKKPYKVKFGQRVSPLRLDRSKHFVLMPNAADWCGYLRNETGFEISRNIGMPYTTSQQPVEVVLNGEYIGLYFLCEKIRVEDGRVDIIEQQDMETNPYNVTGGWLLEFSYDDNTVFSQFENNDPSNNWLQIVAQSPEVLSQLQRDYIHDFIYHADSCIYVADKTDTGWEQYFDINSLARFYVIHEVMENVEAFSGSLYMYKDWGEEEKLHFGPVWDFDNSAKPEYYADAAHFIFDYDTPFQFVWIKELLKFPHFQQTIRLVWKEFKNNNVLDKINEHAAQWRALIIEAEQHDKQRWPFYASCHNETLPAQFLDNIARKVAWLDEQWSVPDGDVNCDGQVNAVDVTIIYNYLLNGDETYKSSCDVNGDGIISSVDITEIYNILLGN